jgi:hypothetical protein
MLRCRLTAVLLLLHRGEGAGLKREGHSEALEDAAQEDGAETAWLRSALKHIEAKLDSNTKLLREPRADPVGDTEATIGIINELPAVQITAAAVEATAQGTARIWDTKGREYILGALDRQLSDKLAKILSGKTMSVAPVVEENAPLRSMKKPKGTQMGDEQIEYIAEMLPLDGNLLVWGLGNDSPFWNQMTSGKVVFLEDDIPEEKDGTLWYDVITEKYPFLDAHKVHYTTENLASFEIFIGHPKNWMTLDLRKQLPPVVLNTDWDVIIVDAPLGCCDVGPGRYQSIYTSWHLAREGTHIFVDDYEREIEQEFSQEVYGGPPERVITRKEDASNANEQAHFIYTELRASTNSTSTATPALAPAPAPAPAPVTPAVAIPPAPPAP